ncbi:MAG: uridine diphosphate-N-acetylglucosamine-binding protein YvcK [Anaerolineae bacterium]
MRSLKWLMPGMRVKRWLFILLAGVTFMALGIAYALIDLYQGAAVPEAWQRGAEFLTLQVVPQWARAVLFAALGLGLVLVGLVRLNQSLLGVVRRSGSGALVDLVDRRRRGQSGPKIVAIGGGTGLSTLLRGLKEHTSTLTAIVTVADDGGSSGRLRRNLGIHPPGDFRQCIAALADTEPLMSSLFEYRFGRGELGGHAFGNLFIVAMTGITGSFESALRASSRVLAVRGRIVPSTLAHVTLSAELADARVLTGEHQVPTGDAPIRRVFLDPSAPAAYPEAVAAILGADLVVVGPGSLYTSVLPNLLVPDLAAAMAATSARVAYVANVATQPGETDGYSLDDHMAALGRHLPGDVFDAVLANDNLAPDIPDSWGVAAVGPRLTSAARTGATLVVADLVNASRPTRHDPDKLAAAVVGIVQPEARRGRRAA